MYTIQRTSKKYKIPFTNQEINKFHILRNYKTEKVISSLMSVYSYLLKLNEKENINYKECELSHLKDQHKLTISMNNFLKLYNRSHNKISIRTLKKRIEDLCHIGLLKIETIKNTNCYSFYRYFSDMCCNKNTVNKRVNKKVNEKDMPSSIENTELSDDFEKHNAVSCKTKNIDIDSKNNSLELPVKNCIDNSELEKTMSLTEEVSFNSTNLPKCSSWSDIANTLNQAFKDLKVRSGNLKAEVIRRLEKNLTSITKKFAKNYIEKVILQIKVQEQRRRAAYKKAIVNNFNGRCNKKDSVWSYENQRNYDWGTLEQCLLANSYGNWQS